jgi:hypothetical protein
MTSALAEKRFHESVPFTGETTGLIREILPAAEIVRRVVEDARAILDQEGRIGQN